MYVDHGDYPNVAEVIRENKVYGMIEICYLETLYSTLNYAEQLHFLWLSQNCTNELCNKTYVSS